MIMGILYCLLSMALFAKASAGVHEDQQVQQRRGGEEDQPLTVKRQAESTWRAPHNTCTTQLFCWTGPSATAFGIFLPFDFFLLRRPIAKSRRPDDSRRGPQGISEKFINSVLRSQPIVLFFHFLLIAIAQDINSAQQHKYDLFGCLILFCRGLSMHAMNQYSRLHKLLYLYFGIWIIDVLESINYHLVCISSQQLL